MSWNYRLVRWRNIISGVPQDEDATLVISEVFYDENGKPRSFGGAVAGGETTEEVRESLADMQLAFDKPILERSDFPDGLDF